MSDPLKDLRVKRRDVGSEPQEPVVGGGGAPWSRRLMTGKLVRRVPGGGSRRYGCGRVSLGGKGLPELGV